MFKNFRLDNNFLFSSRMTGKRIRQPREGERKEKRERREEEERKKGRKKERKRARRE